MGLFDTIVNIFIPITLSFSCNISIIIILAKTSKKTNSILKEYQSNLYHEKPAFLKKKLKNENKKRRNSENEIILVNTVENKENCLQKSNHKIQGNNHDLNKQKSEQKSHYISIMLCAVSLGFIILNLPLAIKIIYERNFNEKRKVLDFLNNINDDITDLTKTGVLNAIKYDFYVHISHFLVDLNYIVNFFLYFLSGSKFRSRLFSIILFKRRERNQNRLLINHNRTTLTTTCSSKL